MTATAALPATSVRRPREYGLDWLRVIAFVILIGYHAGLYFVRWPWIVKNPHSTAWFEWVLSLINRWRLPLLFFISGAGTFWNLERRGYADFTWERLTRLGIPLLFGTLVLCPPQVFVQRAIGGQHYPSYLRFWGTIFTSGVAPAGNLNWMHLWFLAYLLTGSLLLIPLLAVLRGDAGRRMVDRLARACERPGVLYLLAFPGIAVAVFLTPHWPRNYTLVADWAHLTGSLLFFVVGFVVCGNERFLSLVARKRWELLAVAAALSAVDCGLLVVAERVPPPHLLGASLRAVEAGLAMAMVLGLVGLARVHLNHDSPVLRRANPAVYPFYMVHQTITVLLGWAWLDWELPFAVKFPMLCAGTFLGSWAVYELVRRTKVTRVLFGMKA